jgi:hypothetical protein
MQTILEAKTVPLAPYSKFSFLKQGSLHAATAAGANAAAEEGGQLPVRGCHIIGEPHHCGSHSNMQLQGHLVGCKDRDRKKQRKGQNGRMRNENKV